MTHPIVEVSPIKTGLVCAANCETCTSGAVSDCSHCSTSYHLNPTTNACEASCPNGYYEDVATRSCPQCDPACLTCTAAGSSSCSSCSPQYYDAGSNTCQACDPLCDGCTGAGNTMCSSCATNKYLVFSTNTCVSACSDYAANYFLDGSICKQCDPLCATCTGAGSNLCSSCASSYSVEGTQTCVSACSNFAANYYLDSSTCKECDALCATCTGPDNSMCSACVASSYSVEGTNTCVSDCSHHAPNFYLDGTTCKECDAACGTCSGDQPYNCNTCASGFKEILDSTFKDPKQCTSGCGFTTYSDGSDCRSNNA